MKPKLPRAPFYAAILFLSAISPAAHASDGEGWNWMIAPYGWFVGIETDLTLPNFPPGGEPSDVDYPDILRDIDGAFQIHFEGQGDDFGMFADFTLLGLSDERDFDRFHTESDMDTRLFEAAGVWSPGDERGKGIEVFAGLRYIDLDTTFAMIPTNPAFATKTYDNGTSYSDFMLGVRYTFDISERFGVTLRGDGSVGQTEGTWNMSAVADYKMKSGAWFFGYRYMTGELGLDDGRSMDVTLDGPMLGYGFIF